MKILRLFVAFTLICFALLPAAQAVVPAPDGAYPNFTTAEGQNALQDLTIGSGNTALGAYSMFATTTGSFNTAVGAGALDLNTGDNNTAVGVATLLLNTGANNTAVGVDALGLNTAGEFNAAVGAFALYNNTTGNENMAIGYQALHNNTTGSYNTALGVAGLYNTATGVSTTGIWNTGVGHGALFNNTIGSYNMADGGSALFHNTTGVNNTAIGYQALVANTTGYNNTAIGYEALYSNTAGSGNTVIGSLAGSAVLGDDNTIIGFVTGSESQIGSGNIYIGPALGAIIEDESNTIRIADNLPTGQGLSACYIGGISGQPVSGSAVFVGSGGQLGTQPSSKRFKKDVQPMSTASETLYLLKPVSFRYKEKFDRSGKSQFGLIAEEVEKVAPELVVRDEEGKPYSVRYDQVNAMLLNEFLKAHRKIQELEASNAQQQRNFAEQQKQIEALTAGLQKVSTQLEVTKAAPRTVLNNQ
jgi:hypothetical protein